MVRISVLTWSIPAPPLLLSQGEFANNVPTRRHTFASQIHCGSGWVRRRALDGFASKVLVLEISLWKLCVLCVSVVDEFRAKTHHRDTENTEAAQRRGAVWTFRARLRLIC